MYPTEPRYPTVDEAIIAAETRARSERTGVFRVYKLDGESIPYIVVRSEVHAPPTRKMSGRTLVGTYVYATGGYKWYSLISATHLLR